MTSRIAYVIAILAVSSVAALADTAPAPAAPTAPSEAQLETGPMSDWLWVIEGGPATTDVVAERWQWWMAPWVALHFGG
jgi:hypothetical protein